MTTIAYKAGCMAADRLSYIGKWSATHLRKSKIHRLRDGSLVGISTSVVGAAFQLLEWIEQGHPYDSPLFRDRAPDQFTILLVRPDESMLLFVDGFSPQEAVADFMAIGSGADFALGAMEVGATAPAAVRAASRFDAFTVGEFEQLRLDGGSDEA